MKSLNTLTIISVLLLSSHLYGQEEIKSTGLGFRFSYYDGGPHAAPPLTIILNLIYSFQTEFG